MAHCGRGRSVPLCFVEGSPPPGWPATEGEARTWRVAHRVRARGFVDCSGTGTHSSSPSCSSRPRCRARWRLSRAQRHADVQSQRQPTPLGSGRRQPATGKPHAGVAKPGNHPKPIRLSKPVARHLTKAGSAVFDVRSLKSVVVKRERPERQSPFDREHEGAASSAPSTFSSEGSRSQRSRARARRELRRPRLRHLGRRPPARHQRRRRPDLLHPDHQHLDRHLRQVDRRPRRGVHLQHVHEPGQLRQPVRHRQLRRPGRRSTTRFEDRWIITDFAFKLDGSGNVVNPPQRVPVLRRLEDRRPGHRRLELLLDRDTRRPRRLPEVRHLAGRPLHVGQHVRLRGRRLVPATRVWAFNKAQMYAGAPTVQVVDFARRHADFTLLPATRGCRPARRRPARRTTSSRPSSS